MNEEGIMYVVTQYGTSMCPPQIKTSSSTHDKVTIEGEGVDDQHGGKYACVNVIVQWVLVWLYPGVYCQHCNEYYLGRCINLKTCIEE